MPRYRVLDEAVEELVAAANFYDTEYPGLGRDFVMEVRALCRQIASQPQTGVEIRPGIRRRILRRFPYSILYSIESGEVTVLAIAHQGRLPGYWSLRVQEGQPTYAAVRRCHTTIPTSNTAPIT